MLLLCLSLPSDEIEHLSPVFIGFWMTSFVKCLLNSFAFFLVICGNSLYSWIQAPRWYIWIDASFEYHLLVGGLHFYPLNARASTDGSGLVLCFWPWGSSVVSFCTWGICGWGTFLGLGNQSFCPWQIPWRQKLGPIRLAFLTGPRASSFLRIFQSSIK